MAQRTRIGAVGRPASVAASSRGAAISALLATMAAAPAWAQEPPLAEPPGDRPLWEYGVAGFGVFAQDYPAADSYGLNGLVVPFFIYRGEVVRLDDEEGARIVPVETARFDFSLSADAAFGASSGEVEARRGMDDLDTLIQLGPELVFRGPDLDGPGDDSTVVEVALQARAVLSVDVGAPSAAYRGLVFQPVLAARRDLRGETLRLNASVGPVLATEALHDYFYEVEADEVRDDRPAFDARPGYLGTEVDLGVTYDLAERVTVFGGTEIGIYSGAANDDSPLFRREVNPSLFLGLAYTLGESGRRVRRR